MLVHKVKLTGQFFEVRKNMFYKHLICHQCKREIDMCPEFPPTFYELEGIAICEDCFKQLQKPAPTNTVPIKLNLDNIGKGPLL